MQDKEIFTAHDIEVAFTALGVGPPTAPLSLIRQDDRVGNPRACRRGLYAITPAGILRAKSLLGRPPPDAKKPETTDESNMEESPAGLPPLPEINTAPAGGAASPPPEEGDASER
jgi:hypothetical protein